MYNQPTYIPAPLPACVRAAVIFHGRGNHRSKERYDAFGVVPPQLCSCGGQAGRSRQTPSEYKLSITEKIITHTERTAQIDISVAPI